MKDKLRIYSVGIPESVVVRMKSRKAISGVPMCQQVRLGLELYFQKIEETEKHG